MGGQLMYKPQTLNGLKLQQIRKYTPGALRATAMRSSSCKSKLFLQIWPFFTVTGIKVNSNHARSYGTLPSTKGEFYNFESETMDGTKYKTIRDLVGDAKAVLVVNVASVWGITERDYK